MTIGSGTAPSLAEQERPVGRAKASAAPPRARHADDPVDVPLLPDDSHLRLPRPSQRGGARMLRPGFSFVDGSDGLGHLDAGLFLLAYQWHPRTAFVPVQRARLARRDARVPAAHRVVAGRRPRRPVGRHTALLSSAQRVAYGDPVTADRSLISAMRAGLATAADPARAPAMQAYMKSELPYYGVAAPAARKVFAAVLRDHPLPDRARWGATVRALWDGAERREERYGALALCGHRAYRDYQDPATLPLYADLVVTGAWWDLVDDVAAHKVRPILRSFPAEVRPVLLGWAAHDDLWLRRTAIIAQLGSKAGTDLDLLVACLEPNLERREFFLRKAIGWALRQYAWVDPVWVREYVAEHEDRLSPLSRREALKNIQSGSSGAA